MGRGGSALFRDDQGVQWTASWRPARELLRVEFVTETGDRRATEVQQIPDRLWARCSECAWRALLDVAKPA